MDHSVFERGFVAAFLAVSLAGTGYAKAETAPLRFLEVAPSVYVYRGAHGEAGPENSGSFANLGFVVGEESVAIVDTGGSFEFGTRLLAWIRSVTPLPIRYVINTHVHPDHIFGNAALVEAEATFVGHHKLPRAMIERAPFYQATFRRLIGAGFEGSEPVIPTVLVKDFLSLDLGNRILRLQAHATAHTDNDLTVLDEKTGTLFAGDLLFMERSPVVDGSLKGWLSVSSYLSNMPADQVVPGHGPHSAAWPAALDAQTRYLGVLLKGVRAVIAAGGTISDAIETVGGNERANWLLFDDNHPRNVTSSFTELEWE